MIGWGVRVVLAVETEPGACSLGAASTNATASELSGSTMPAAATLTAAPTGRLVATISAAVPASSNPMTPTQSG